MLLATLLGIVSLGLIVGLVLQKRLRSSGELTKRRSIFSKLLFVLLAVMSSRAFAMWPPSTTIEAETTGQNEADVLASTMTASENLAVVAQRLNADERRLAAALVRIEEDEKALLGLTVASVETKK
ncbi:MAG: hypothetical protein JO102_04535 [Elusimicrobia bacterium]|nr:hypothetical protein [Elusimicrobiota bacterium]